MNHHLDTSLSASATSALHVLGAHVRSFAPSSRIVLSVVALVSAGVPGVAGVGVASSYTSVTFEVSDVSRFMTSRGNTVGDALHAAGVSAGSSDLVRPGTGETIRDDDTITTYTSKPYAMAIDDRTRTLWITASSVGAIPTDAVPLGSAVSLAANRSSSRDELTPLASRARNIVVTMDGTARRVAVRPGQDAHAIPKASGVFVYPLGHVDVATGEAGEPSINVSRVTRGEATEAVEVLFSETMTTNSNLSVSESQVTTVGANGVTTWTVWQEKKDEEVLTTVPITKHPTSQPVTQIRSEGTREATPAALVAAGIDPRVTLKGKIEADGTTSVCYRVKLGTISTKEEITIIAANTENTDSATTAIAAAATATAGVVPTTYSGEDPRSLAKSLVAAQGWGDSEYQCLVLLWSHESQWNPHAEDASSGAYSIPQSLPDSRAASADADQRTNSTTRINRGVDYTKGRCGTPCSAWARSSAVSWY